MIEYVIRGATDDDAIQLAPIMRDLDRKEVWAASAKTPLEALRAGLQTADVAHTAFADEIPFGMFGVSPYSLLSNTASPWLLCSKDVEIHQKELLRWSKRVAFSWLDSYSILINYIDARHLPGLRWASWVGFSISEPFPFGPFKKLFHRIELRKK